MKALNAFLAYADAFEKTFIDDDWSRLHQYFHDDAVYEVVGDIMACKLVGPDAIFAGMKKSLDGLDRRFDTRAIQPGDDLKVEDNALSLSWSASYTLESHPPFILQGRSEAELKDGKISLLRDSYDASAAKAFQNWVNASGVDLAPGYI
ncbi:MAG: nuclear transport factor 2 family protein [Pseudomonadales bacterium]|nr:nuclear transport factor 2 family protein [Pseudomonadales bacterium]